MSNLASFSEAPPADMLGGLLIGVCFALMLFGVTVVQTYVYFLRCSRDPWWTKGIVIAVCLFETVHIISSVRLVYFETIIIQDSTDNSLLEKIDWSIPLGIICQALIVGLVQGFYALRLWLLSEASVVLAFCASVVTLLRVVLLFVVAGESVHIPNWTDFSQHYKVSIRFSLAAAVIVNTTIAVVSIHFMRRNDRVLTLTNERPQTQQHKLVTYLLNTGALLSLISIAVLVTFLRVKDSLLFVGLSAIENHLYANTLLGLLASRLVPRRGNATGTTMVFSSAFYAPTSTTIASSRPQTMSFA